MSVHTERLHRDDESGPLRDLLSPRAIVLFANQGEPMGRWSELL